MSYESLLLNLFIVFGMGIVVRGAGRGRASRSSKISLISKKSLQAMLASPELVLIDVRNSTDWESGDSKIRGAIREDPQKVEEWTQNYSPNKTLVFYCSSLDEATSVQVTQYFIGKGYRKVFALRGGWTEWHKTKYPVERK